MFLIYWFFLLFLNFVSYLFGLFNAFFLLLTYVNVHIFCYKNVILIPISMLHSAKWLRKFFCFICWTNVRFAGYLWVCCYSLTFSCGFDTFVKCLNLIISLWFPLNSWFWALTKFDFSSKSVLKGIWPPNFKKINFFSELLED